MQLAIETSQKIIQVLSPQLVQHLEILQYTTNELEQYIYEKANENPLLAVTDAKVKMHYEEIMQLASYSDKNYSAQHYAPQHHSFNPIEMKFAVKESYEKFLLEQVPMHKNLSSIDLRILTFLIQSLDERLFLDVDLEVVASICKTDVMHVEALLDLLQTFEPVGVGARNYKEFLFIQVDSDALAPKLASRFIESDLELVAAQAIKQLSKKYKTSLYEVQKTIRYIKNLNPVIMGDQLEAVPYVMPEIEVERLEEEWLIKLNRGYLPVVTIDKQYVEMLKNNPNCKTYFKDTMRDALLLLQGIEQRDKTLYELARLLVELQEDFFHKGMEALKPMRLKDVADNLSLHVSTISRAVRGKYIKTSHGVYALQSLFTKGVMNISGKMDSIMYIKKRLKQLIEGEDKQKPLTDQQIKNTLNVEGIQISRRTVAKYREEMNIMSSFNRVYG
ncbi:RNA polymerase subunit sigma-54 [Lysinibacillus sphaericus]|uniref:RNA polymerase factor sigma-54 n=1 Tax=Lysinibacillus sphaericus TaxID=1421 RepID=UPI0018CE74D3|nr:RNA polymerase factor sigma-54 [Lysinibacillus sphaericus]MBG9456543.1 RNA polymerase subunit sigma-54 [Lysinibacillus sphaericus]MBG9479943.1 RNA polymerase subunit sigma-54 [Lysinibacillus sphaericus]MBG9594691.1 RNA polymerase subunit sigma-54 [Lysinibacillus sphaericus]